MVWLWSVAVLLLLAAQPAPAVPAKIANRMVPSWWQYARTTCYGQRECGAGECCARPMLSSRAYCMPLKGRDAACDASPFMLDADQMVHFGDCPCEAHLVCAPQDSAARCVDYHGYMQPDYHRYLVTSADTSF
ncbi:uncharacterized protein LOC108671237 [Hyalella azteca]|uniref:Uncharacterized protein LOC108671237 n=1 Tax=Hyalella azteca TaxID=294128 RepID=A0A979FWW8_HYAAZ|nr:uncharacterized protein LOC108671237 [Hyalella azteca]